MKKFLIIMLSVLLLLSFTSCEKDKSGDVIAAFEKFANEKEVAFQVWSLFSPDESKKNITTTDVDESTLSYLLAAYYDEDGDQIIGGTRKVTDASGSITVDGNKYTYDLSFSCDEYKYGESEKYRTTDFVISGSCEYKSESVERGTGTSIITLSSDITVNGKNYKLSYTQNGGTKKYSAASVDGTAVELRLLNAGK